MTIHIGEFWVGYVVGFMTWPVLIVLSILISKHLVEKRSVEDDDDERRASVRYKRNRSN